jgi:P-type Cu+ transporter
MRKDPVCGMAMEEKSTIRKSEFEGRTYYFCSAACKDRFDYEPTAFLHPQPMIE